MKNKEQEILKLDNITANDTTYTLYLNSKLQKSKDDIKNGRVITLEELDREREALQKKF